MTFGLTEEQVELGRTATRLMHDTARSNPLPPAWDALPLPLDRSLWSSLAKLGLLGLAVPEELGGSGAGVLEQCVLAEEMGAALPAVPFAGTAAVTAVLAAHHADEAARSTLAGIAGGTVVVTPAWETFPSALVPRRRAGSVQLRGTQVQGVLGAVPFGLDAGLLLAFAEIADDPAAPAVPVLVTLSAPGVRRTAVEALDVVEPVVAVELGSATATPLTPAAFPAPEIRTVLAAELVGTARRALQDAVAYAGARRQFGRPIGSFQSIKHMLADRYVQLDAARLLVHHSARAIDTGAAVAAGLEAASRTALVAATDAADAATADALQTHGGIGFTWEHPSHVLLKRARARRSMLGSPATQLDALAGFLL